jgi:predicted small lipoprotein YifL
MHRWLPILIALCLAACGQRGALYLPEEPAAEAAVAADAPGEESADDEDPDEDEEQDDAPEP